MIKLCAVILSLLAVAIAAPYYDDFGEGYRHPPHFRPPGPHSDRFFQDGIFDTKRFWDEFSREMHQFDTIMQDFHKHFPGAVSSAGIKDGRYVVTVPLAGFEEKDVIVKARVGVLMVQAVHKYDEHSTNNYLDVRTLPDFVNPNGSWTFSNEVLTISFPVDSDHVPTPPPAVHPTTESEIVTSAPEDRSREELEPSANGRDVEDIETRGDNFNELETNEIRDRDRVEATTYAVDLKNEVEFVPVHRGQYQ